MANAVQSQVDDEVDQQGSTDRKLVYLLWLVVVTLVLGVIAGGSLLVNKSVSLSNANVALNKNIQSMKSELQAAKASSPQTSDASTGSN